MLIRTSEEKQQIIRNCAMFHNVPDSALASLAQFSKSKDIKNREVICHRGESGSSMFFIVSGKVNLNTDSDEGKELTFSILAPGDFFGEIALLDGGPRTATVKALERTELLVIERRYFLPFLEKNPKVAIHLLSTLASRLRKTDELYQDTIFLNLPGRLAKRFLGLADEYGKETNKGLELGIKLSQGDLGKLTGATRESINKQIKAWEDEGIIICENGQIIIPEPEKLEAISE